jgi:hypothetical protein
MEAPTNSTNKFMQVLNIIKNFIIVNLFIFIIVGITIFIIGMMEGGKAALRQTEYNAKCFPNKETRLDFCMKNFSDIPDLEQQPLKETYNNIFYNNPVFPHALRDYFYAASYKSYLPCGNTNDIVSIEPLQQIIKKGIRVINLDIFYDGEGPFEPQSKIVVGNVIEETITAPDSNNVMQTYTIKKLSTIEECDNQWFGQKYLEFIDCLNLIKSEAWVKYDTPFFLYLNMEFEPNTRLEYQIFSQIVNTMPKRLLDKFYGFQRVNIGAVPYKRAKNKLIIITNRKPVNNFLDEITNSVMSPLSVGIKLYTLSPAAAKLGDPLPEGLDPVISQARINTGQNMVAVIKTNPENKNNIFNPKIDIENYDTAPNFERGVSITFFNFQIFDKNDENCKKYMTKFKNGGVVLKPESYWYIPKPPEPRQERNKQMDYNNVSVQGLGGFMDFNI